VISAIASTLNSRQVRTVALAKPSDRERSEWYFQRYVPHLPATGELVLFDRSWYNRAGVEKVMGYCTDAEYERFLDQAPVFERMLVDDGVLLFKYWLSVDQAEQEERWPSGPPIRSSAGNFADRSEGPRALYRLHPGARRCSRPPYGTPWHVVRFDDQRRGGWASSGTCSNCTTRMFIAAAGAPRLRKARERAVRRSSAADQGTLLTGRLI
jgi:hypothetical protein